MTSWEQKATYKQFPIPRAVNGMLEFYRLERCHCSGTIELPWTHLLCCQTVSLSTSLSYKSIWLYHCFHYLVAIQIPALLSWVLCCCEPQIALFLHLLSWNSVRMKCYTIIMKGEAWGKRCILKVSKQLRNLLESNNWLRLYISISLCD